MKNFILLLSVLFIVAACSWMNKEIPGSGQIITEKREVRNFSRLTSSIIGVIDLQQSAEESLTVEGDDNLAPYISTVVREGTLYIEEKSPGIFQRLKPTKPFRVSVSMKNIEEINLSGEGILSSNSQIHTKNLSLNVSGSEKISLDLKLDHLQVNSSGSSEFNFKGEVNSQTINISGTSEYNASQLVSQESDIKLSGYSKISVQAIDKLNVDISGSGMVYYIGQPTITQTITGIGKIEPLK